MPRFSKLLIDRGGLLALVSLLAYAWIAPAHLSTGDNAEFAGLASLGGAAHPPGYPLYVVWLRAWSWLPAASPAHAAALATCVLGAATVLMTHAACRAAGATPTSASFAAALVASSPLSVRLHSEAEVFAMNGFLAATILWLSARGGPLRGTPRTAALALIAGLALSNHLTSVLLAPIGILGAVRGIQESERRGIAVVAIAVGCLLVGLTPYAYLLASEETRVSWGKIAGFDGLLHHVLRMDYGGPGQLGPVDRGGSVVDNLGALLRTHLRAYLGVGLVLGAVVLVLRCARRPATDADESRAWWRALAATWLLVGPLLVARFNLHPSGFHAFITQRFHLLPTIVFAIPVAAALDLAGRRLAAHASPALRRSSGALGVLAVVTMIALVTAALPRIANARSPATEQALRNMLVTLPPDAVVIGTPDDFHFGLGYLQGALGLRTDVTVITWQQVGLPHVRERIRRELGITVTEVPAGSAKPLSVVVADEILATGRPLFIDHFQGNIAKAFPIHPYGLLFRVLPPGSRLPTVDELFELTKSLYERYEFGYELPDTDALIPAEYHRLYAAVWTTLADALARAGRTSLAQEARDMASLLAPRSP